MSDHEFADGFFLDDADAFDADRDSNFGKVLAPYGGVTLCALSTCQKPLDEVETEGAYMFRDLETGKLVLICGKCTPGIELNHRERFLLVPL